MTTTGTFTVDSTNDEQFEVGATYSITLSVSQSLVGFGVTKLSDPPSPAEQTTETSVEVEGGGEPSAETSIPNPDSTPPATP